MRIATVDVISKPHVVGKTLEIRDETAAEAMFALYDGETVIARSSGLYRLSTYAFTQGAASVRMGFDLSRVDEGCKRTREP
jgi:hypothetical protein